MKAKTYRNIVKITAYIALTVLFLFVFCNKTWAGQVQFPGTRYTPPPNVLPSPQPPKQNWADGNFYKWEAKEVVTVFKDAGLEVVDAKPAYTMGLVMPREAMMFLMPSYGENIGGFVSSYNSEDDFKEMKEHYLNMNKDPEAPAWWIFEKDNIMLLISGRVPREKADQYGKVLKELVKK